MPAIITTSLRIVNSDTFAKNISLQPTFLFIGKETPWADEDLPDYLYETDKEKVQIFKDISALKRVQTSDINSVIPRINWTSGIVYDQYDHRINMIDGRKVNGARYQFYVLTDEFNVYKCLSNNGGARSTSKPTSQQVTDFQTPDGYVWKFMYTIRSTDVFNYMTQDWIPAYTVDANDGSSQWQVQRSAIDGAIHNVVVEIPGAGYNPTDPPVVTITGDGTGATAVVDINPATGGITRVRVTSVGSGYTYADVTLTNVGAGAGASLVPIIAPAGGHGRDARQELGAVYKMVKLSIAGSESGTFPLTSFRQAGLIQKPLCQDIGSVLTVASTNGYNNGDTVTGGTTGATGTIRLVDANERLLWVDNVVGDFIQSEVISNGSISSTLQSVDNNTNLVLVDAVTPASNVLLKTGELLYISNREVINRAEAQTEEVRLIIYF